jgi:Holliday junction resolvase-like predicted endonuclease/predicted nucleic acid-binding protein
MNDQEDFLKWLEETLATPLYIKRYLEERTRTYIILGKEAEKFVAELFMRLGYNVTLNFRVADVIFDLLAQKENINLLIEVKLRASKLPTSIFERLFLNVQRMTNEFAFYLVSFDKSSEVIRIKEKFQRFFPKGRRVDWISIEDLLGLSDYKPACGSLNKEIGISLLKKWQNRMVHCTMMYFESKGLEKPKEIAQAVVKLANKREELIVDDFDIIKTLNLKIKERFPQFFESYTFLCEKCNKRYRMVPIFWNERKNEYIALCPECKEKIKEVALKVPITVNIQTVVADTSAIIDSVISKLLAQKILPSGVLVIIPEVVDQELEMMEKPHPSLKPEVKYDLKRKFKMALKELQLLEKYQLNGLIRLERHVGERLSEKEIKLKIQGIDKHVADRLLIATCKEIGGLLITKDEGLATRATLDKINTFLIKHHGE